LIRPGRRVAIVDDVATSGQSCLDAVEAAQSAGCEVVTVVVLVDRQQGARARFEGLGIQFESLYAADAEGNLTVSER
jgi:orotate phosphoribosyltransferase